MSEIPSEFVSRFAKLFRGNLRSKGYFNSTSGSMHTVKEEPEFEDYESHLAGGVGLGVVPIMDDDRCWFGAIDIDAHGDAPDIDLVSVEETIREKDLPLMACRSKSGGAHLYVFGSEPLPARVLRSALAKWAEQLGFAGVEIFPKQDHLSTDNEGIRQLGNWINLGLFNADSKDCARYAVEGGKKVKLEYFLDLAESRRVSTTMLVERSANEHEEAPPCIQKMIANGVGRGQRNEALYNFVVYLKQAYPETWKDKAFDLNAKVFDDPLEHSEAKKTITSAGRRDYRYRCREEPCRSLCASSICITRKFGITPEEKSEMEVGAPPEFGPLEKFKTDPVRWNLYVDSSPITLSTNELMDYRLVRLAVAENLTRLIAPMKNDKWQATLHKLMQEVVEVDAPDEASSQGFIRSRLYEFFQRTDLSSPGDDKADRESLLLGAPVVQLNESTGKRCVYFRGTDFIDYLRKNRSEELKGPNLWMALRRVGVCHTKIRVGKKVVPVWYVPIDEDDVLELPNKEVEPEI